MVLNAIKQFNWVDIFIVIILFRISYIAIKNGFSQEIFKLSGTLLALYLALHYYSGISDLIARRIGWEPKSVPWLLLNLISFIVLVILGYLILVVLRRIFWRLIKFEAVQQLNKWGGFILGICRGILLTGLIIYILVITPLGYLTHSVRDSYSGKYWVKVAPVTYSWLWHKVMSKFMTFEKFNLLASEVQEDLQIKK